MEKQVITTTPSTSSKQTTFAAVGFAGSICFCILFLSNAKSINLHSNLSAISSPSSTPNAAVVKVLDSVAKPIHPSRDIPATWSAVRSQQSSGAVQRFKVTAAAWPESAQGALYGVCCIGFVALFIAMRKLSSSHQKAFPFACCILIRGQQLDTVVVTGATGRTGLLVVKALLERGDAIKVRAVVRSTKKAAEVLPSSDRLEVVTCDLGNERQVAAVCKGADAVIWCATGFSSNSSPFEALKNLFGLKVMKQSIDISALKIIGEAMKEESGATAAYPRVVMCSSAAVTRSTWSEEKKQRLIGASDIPIVRLNPFGVLDLKRQAEQTLRDTGASYTIIRPTGLNAQLEKGRPVFSQGDIAVGRISRGDVAELLVRLLMEEPECIGKTFEVLALPGLPSPRSFEQQLSRLLPDSEPLDEAMIQGQYNILQQLLPGETLEANRLAMGQTYEQLDRGETGRLGKRGEEAVPGVTNFGG